MILKGVADVDAYDRRTINPFDCSDRTLNFISSAAGGCHFDPGRSQTRF
jgi:hypothetical protein